uniref:Uncharacterized protein n=1 Tax=Octopus bimaculoides TaxID=37653 RepID=A0A0L8FLB0_OCTBM
MNQKERSVTSTGEGLHQNRNGERRSEGSKTRVVLFWRGTVMVNGHEWMSERARIDCSSCYHKVR